MHFGCHICDTTGFRVYHNRTIRSNNDNNNNKQTKKKSTDWVLNILFQKQSFEANIEENGG